MDLCTASEPTRDERRDRTARLLAEAAGSPEPERSRLLDEVVVLNTGVARAVARRFGGRGVAVDDLEQVACLALVRAVRRFDATREHDFLSFAVPTMSGEVKRYFRDQGWMVKPPRRVQELRARATSARAEADGTVGHDDRDVAQRLGVGLDELREALGATACFTPVSLDGTRDDERPWEPADPQGDDDLASAEARVTLSPLLRCLDERERYVLRLLYVDGLLQREVGERLGVTQAQVSRLQVAILAKLRHRAGVPAAA